MAYIVLEKEILEEFLKFFLHKDYDNSIIKNLLNHFKPFVVTKTQLKELLKKLMGENNPLIQRLITNSSGFWTPVICDKELYSDDFYKELLEQSKFKILLTKNAISLNTLDCHKICIKNDATHFFAKKFDSGSNRDKAQKHIISLMKNANKITIIDRFLYKENIINNLINWFTANHLNHEIEFTLKGQKSQLSRNTITSRFNNEGYNVTCKLINDTTHDRYIIIDDKISINLTSGLENLFNTKKDFTYIISEKQYP